MLNESDFTVSEDFLKLVTTKISFRDIYFAVKDCITKQNKYPL